MKRFKKLALSILGVTVLSLGLYACSNDDSVNEEKKSLAKETNKEDLIKELANDSDFVEYVKLNIDEGKLNYDINLVNKLIKDNQVTEDEEDLVPIALGYTTMSSFKQSLEKKIFYLKKVDNRFKLERFNQLELSNAVAIVTGDDGNTILNDCKRERNNCYNISLGTAILGHIACAPADATILGGFACHGAVMLIHTSMNDNCEINYDRCKKQ